MRRLAGVEFRRPWWIVGVAAIVFVLGFAVGGPLTGNLSSGGFQDPASEFVAAQERLEEATGVTPDPAVIALVDPGVPIASAEGRAAVDQTAATLAEDDDVGLVVGPFTGGGEALISADGESAYVVANFRPISDDAASDAATRIQEAFADDEDVRLGGAAVVGEQTSSIIGEDLARAELIALPILFLLSLWIFRGLVAALLPVLMGALVIFATFLSLGLINETITVSVFSLNLAIGLSLGLAIDYSLLILSRYREEIAQRGATFEALLRTMQTAGRSVFFSAVTVAAALAGLMIFPQNFLFSMGLAGVLVAALAGTAALVVLPAVLALLGTRINALAPRAWQRKSAAADELVEAGFWYRLSRSVMRRPGLIAGVTALALIIVALPAFRIAFNSVDASTLPTSASGRQVADVLEADFPQDRSAPVIVAVSAPPSDQAAVTTYAAEIGELPGVAAVVGPELVGPDTWRIDALPSGAPLDDETKDIVVAIRDIDGPDALVAGVSAAFVDQQESLAGRLPWAIAIVAAVTIVALFLMTGSVLLPVKAVIMNLLTLGATLGLMVLIFQDGRLTGLLNYDPNGALDLTQPILLGALAFGLSTDYAVFLLSRIKEARDSGLSNDEAVAVGLQRTGRIVTAAALLFAVAIGAFAISDIKLIKELGVGTAIAVLIDATVIRAFLVPSLMKLLGNWNWWAPGPLRRFHDRFGWKEGEPPEPQDEPRTPVDVPA